MSCWLNRPGLWVKILAYLALPLGFQEKFGMSTIKYQRVDSSEWILNLFCLSEQTFSRLELMGRPRVRAALNTRPPSELSSPSVTKHNTKCKSWIFSSPGTRELLGAAMPYGDFPMGKFLWQMATLAFTLRYWNSSRTIFLWHRILASVMAGLFFTDFC